MWIMENGGVLHWNGRRFTGRLGSFSSSILDIHGSASRNAWIVGSNGVVIRRDEEGWRPLSSLTTAEFVSLGGNAADDVWTFTARGRTFHWDGEMWSLVPRPVPGNDRFSGAWFAPLSFYQYRSYTDAWFIDQNDAWAVETMFFAEDVSRLWHWDGTRWRDRSAEVPGLMDSPRLTGIWGWGADRLFVVFDPNTLMRCNGRAWVSMARRVIPESSNLEVVGGSGLGDVWAAGMDSSVHFDGSRWTRAAFPPAGVTSPDGHRTTHPRGIWSISQDDAWIVGDYRNAALHWDGNAWSVVATGHSGPLSDVWASGPDDVWAVGAGGTILHWNGNSWTRVDSGTTGNLTHVWGSGPRDIWVVGRGGIILRYQPVEQRSD